MSEKISAGVISGPGKLEIHEFEKPELENGAILAKVEAAGVCGTDVNILKGGLNLDWPIIPGHECVARIEEIGGKVEKRDVSGKLLKEGDRIVWHPGITCGTCYACVILQEPTMCSNRFVYGLSTCKKYPYLLGEQAEYVYVTPNTPVIKVPDELDTDTLSSILCGGMNLLHGIERIGGIQIGDQVVIQGSGPVGIAATIFALESGASRIVVIGGGSTRLKFIKKLHPEIHVIDIAKLSSPEKRVEMVKEIMDGMGADVVIESAGTPEAFRESIMLARPAGKILEFGNYTDKGDTAIKPHLITKKQLNIMGCWGATTRHLFKFVRFLAPRRDKYPLKEMVTKYALKDIHKAYKDVENLNVIRAVITP